MRTCRIWALVVLFPSLHGLAANCVNRVEPFRLAVDAAGVATSVTVVADETCPWSASGLVDWIKVSTGDSGTGNGSVSLTIAPNSNHFARVGQLAVGGKLVWVFQARADAGDGFVIGWGDNDWGKATPPAGLVDAQAVAAGVEFSLALRADGTVLGWGDNRNGATSIPAGLTGVVAIAAGNAHGLALTGDGRVTGWGSDVWAQAVPPAGLSNVVSISAGPYHSLALLNDGRVVSWGITGDFGQDSGTTNLADVVAIDGGSENVGSPGTELEFAL